MNYIKQLQHENTELKQQLAVTERDIKNVLEYLSCPKFQGIDNDYVHVSTDIKHRIQYLLNNIKSV